MTWQPKDINEIAEIAGGFAVPEQPEQKRAGKAGAHNRRIEMELLERIERRRREAEIAAQPKPHLVKRMWAKCIGFCPWPKK